MTEKPKRPILHLKFPPSTPIAVPGASVASAAPPKALTWKCKPCGKPFQVLSEQADDEWVRCPACNARLGLASDFRSEPPNLEKVRARQALEAPPQPVATPRPFVRGSIGSRRAR